MAAGNKLIQIPSVNFNDKDLQLLQDNINKGFVQIQQSPFIGGSLIKSVSVGTSPTVINHGLQRVPQAWVAVDQDTNTTVKRTAWDTNTITLQAGSACVIALWVN